MSPVKLFLDSIIPCRLPEIVETAKEFLSNLWDPWVTCPPSGHKWTLKLLRSVISFYVSKSCRRIRLTSCWNLGVSNEKFTLNKEKQPSASPKIEWKNPRWQKHNRHEQWQCIFKWKTSMQNKNFGVTDDLDRSEYEKPTDTWLVREMHATGSLTGHEAKLTPGRYLQVIGVGISISSIYWWAVRWRKCPKRGKKKNKQELDWYEILILRNAHSISASLSSRRCTFFYQSSSLRIR